MAVDLAGSLSGLRYQKRDGVARITLDRPERGNALTPGMQPIIRAIWSDVREDPAVRVAVVTAVGEKHFCTGFDVGSDASVGARPARGARRSRAKSTDRAPTRRSSPIARSPTRCTGRRTRVASGSRYCAR